MRLRMFPDGSDPQHDRQGGLQTLAREVSPDGVIAARWAGELERSARRRGRDALGQVRAELAQTRAELAHARAEVAELRRERESARADAATWQRRHADAAADCESITVRRDALIDSLAPALRAMLLGASLRAWDEGWDAASTDSLVKWQNPHRHSAVEAGDATALPRVDI